MHEVERGSLVARIYYRDVCVDCALIAAVAAAIAAVRVLREGGRGGGVTIENARQDFERSFKVFTPH